EHRRDDELRDERRRRARISQRRFGGHAASQAPAPDGPPGHGPSPGLRPCPVRLAPAAAVRDAGRVARALLAAVALVAFAALVGSDGRLSSRDVLVADAATI